VDHDEIEQRLRRELEAVRGRVAALEATFDDVVRSAEDVATDDEHDPEGHTIAFERQQVASLLEESRAQAAELAGGLDRLAAGTYGRCEACGGSIAPARLAALPAARRCIACAA
jgi:RNA polymerase-binding transcription factor DksA